MSYLCIKIDLHMCRQSKHTYVGHFWHMSSTRVEVTFECRWFTLRLLTCQKWPTYVSKVTYECVQKDLHTCRKSTHNSLGWCCMRSLRCVISTCQKRHTYVSKETHMLVGGVHRNHLGVAYAVCAAWYEHVKEDIHVSKEAYIYVKTDPHICRNSARSLRVAGVAACCSVLQHVAICVPCAAVSCSVLQCVAVWGSVLQCVAVCCTTGDATHELHRLCSVISTLFNRQIRMCPKKP